MLFTLHNVSSNLCLVFVPFILVPVLGTMLYVYATYLTIPGRIALCIVVSLSLFLSL